MEFGKNANPGDRYAGFTALVLFQLVWRQSGFAFFSALTSVGALFILCGEGGSTLKHSYLL